MSIATYPFPRDFLFGAATSALQIEGSLRADGAGETSWEHACKRPGFLLALGDIEAGSGHYTRVKEDVRLMKELGLQAYRFSVNWARIFPDGTGQVNEKGLDFYSALVDELLANGIEPFLTIFHWETPQALEDRWGGWRSKETARALADYAGVVSARLSDRVTHFFTVNEIPCFTTIGYTQSGVGFAPAVKCTAKETHQAVFNAFLGHGLSLQAIRAAARRPVQVGIAECPSSYIVPFTSEQADVDAARRAFRDYNTEAFTLLFEGAYPERFIKQTGPENMPDFTDEEMKAVTTKMDFLGLNIYTAQPVMADPGSETGYRLLEWPESFACLDMPGNFIVPESVYYAPLFCQQLWNTPPIYISENGFCCRDERPFDEPRIDDTGRVSALRQYLFQVQRAIADGVDIRGYFYWSLMDNFEWRFAMSKRLGLVHIDYNTMVRTPKLSAEYYRRVIRAHAVL